MVVPKTGKYLVKQANGEVKVVHAEAGEAIETDAAFQASCEAYVRTLLEQDHEKGGK